MDFHIHTIASLLVVGALLTQNVRRKSDKLIFYASRLFNSAKQNYSITKKNLNLVFTLHIDLSIICWEISLCFMVIIWL
jgi:hypothetical protein